MENKSCPVCGKLVHGRSDKVFCTIKCKSQYHYDVHKLIQPLITKTNRILERNYIILLEVMQGRIRQTKIPRIKLDRYGFNYKYHTGYHINSKGKTYHHVYDYSWMEFSDQEVYIVKNNKA